MMMILYPAQCMAQSSHLIPTYKMFEKPKYLEYGTYIVMPLAVFSLYEKTRNIEDIL